MSTVVYSITYINIIYINIIYMHFSLWKRLVDMKYSIVLKIMKVILNFSYENSNIKC
jgi:hypothetical protein